MKQNIVPVIISGGAGTRLWPVSREAHPKPFIKLSDGESLLQKAFLRVAGLPGVEEVFTVTNRELYFKTEDEYRAVNTGHVKTSYILEPFGRNTAPAITAAALHIQEIFGPETILLVLPADHLIANKDAFAYAVQQAQQLANKNFLTTFGIKPDSPETGYGYIEFHHDQFLLENEHSAHRAIRFVEKPNYESAVEYINSGCYLWNSGMFCFTAGTLLKEMDVHAKNVFIPLQLCLDSSRRIRDENASFVELDANTLRNVPDISIDYALMEKSSNVAVVSCDIGWSDIGSWNSIHTLTQADEHGNRVVGEALLHDVSNCYIQSNKRIVGAVGVENLIIVDTTDALLVAHNERTQDVKQIVQQLKQIGHEAFKLHRTVHRPWGTYTILEEDHHFKIKRIEVKPGAALSLQMHHHRSEHWIVVSGTAKVTIGEKSFLLCMNESTFIPAGNAHRLENPGVVPLIMIEVQSGEYLGEDDIVRFEDNYGRT